MLKITDNQRKRLEYGKMKNHILWKKENYEISNARAYVKKYNMKSVKPVMNSIKKQNKYIRYCNTLSKWEKKSKEIEQNNPVDLNYSDEEYKRYETCILIDENLGIIINATITHKNMQPKMLEIYDMIIPIKKSEYKQEYLFIDGEKYSTDELLRAAITKNVRIYEVNNYA